MSRIIMIAFGTRGDVQPAVALGKGLKASGHQVRILASSNFRAWIEQHGLEAAVSNVDVQKMMAGEGGIQWVEQGNNPMRQLRIMKQLFAEMGWGMMLDAWQASQDADVLVTGFTSDVYGIAIAEKLEIRHVSMPVQPALIATRDGRAISAIAPLPDGNSLLNYLFSWLFVDPLPWRLVGDITNRFRQEVLGLARQTAAENRAARRRILTLHGYSPHVAPPAADWPTSFHITGYWFLDEEKNWQPPPDLQEFIAAGPPPVYVGFGSMTGSNPTALTQLLIEAIQQSDQRAILLAGWAGLGHMSLPDTIYCLEAAPHNWLFPRMEAVIHHGGSGTTAEGLRAGVPTVIVPHLGDQLFWGRRVAILGVGPEPIPCPKLTAERLAKAIHTAVTDNSMRQRAANLGQKIRAECGVETAVKLINQHL